MKLFFAPGTISLATLIVLCEADADFEPIAVNFANQDQTKPEYLAVNPKGRVPALVTKQGILTETPALMTYIAENHPAANLIPDTAYERAKMNEMLSYLASTVHINHAHKMRGHRWANNQSSFEDMRAKVPETVFNSFSLIEESLTGPWAIGTQYTIADAHLFTIANWMQADGVDPSRLPKIAAHIARMRDRPAVKKAHEIMG
ncbi:glutathione S-transferase [Amylibacter sp. SFDW26]|uniref:glutathione S-transferase family protein n=1 Tax=Amylibacter sp. SFDW26 TaxID=2652722 RepID=UPI0012623917|nr:glutathione S-transferase N-terminal domain-containing protein [Amylibacter sp. SFDW26]KAB7610406.1 glutathione S-transferase [Amylibacter sp. SFDW26]